MDKKTKGSWLIHHTNKLQCVTSQQGYNSTFIAGKAGILLSAISADDEISIGNDRLNVLAEAANINSVFELPMLVNVLKKRELIDVGSNGIAVLGVTTSKVLEHTSDIFDSSTSNPKENAAIALAEAASIRPVESKTATAELSDKFKISASEVASILHDAREIGFVDAEPIDSQTTLFFNGNLFRRETAAKVKLILDSLKQEEQVKLNELTETLRKKACISVETARKLLGDVLFSKVNAIGLFDINVVSNSTEASGFVTLPSAFSKYSSAMVDDAFDLAKAFVSSITYGMTKSYHERGRIRMVEALLAALVRGESVGPVQAIQQDYKILEFKGVVKVSVGTKNGRTGPMMKLLKREVGELALEVIRNGDISEHSLTALPTAAVTKFEGPEVSRQKIRRAQVQASAKSTNDMLTILRTGGGF